MSRLLGLVFMLTLLIPSISHCETYVVDEDFGVFVRGTGNTKPDLSRIFGRIQIVDRFGDFKVKIVPVGADLTVTRVSMSPDRAGRWQIVDSSPDFKIQIVEVGADFTVRFTD